MPDITSNLKRKFRLVAAYIDGNIVYDQSAGLATTTLTTAVANTVVTTITVASTTGMLAGHSLKIDSEYMVVVSIALLVVTVTRGSSPATHASGATVTNCGFVATLVGSPTVGVDGVTFNGTTQYIHCGTGPIIANPPTAEGITLAFHGLKSTDGSGVFLARHYYDGADDNYNYVINPNGSHQIEFLFTSTANSYLAWDTTATDFNTTLLNGASHDLAFTFLFGTDSSAKLYLDDMTTALTGSGLSGNQLHANNASEVLTIGASLNASGNPQQMQACTILEVDVYARQLTSGDLVELFTAPPSNIITVTPSTIEAGTAGTLTTLTLTCATATWNGGTAFTSSDTTNAAIVTTIINSGTSSTLTIATRREASITLTANDAATNSGSATVVCTAGPLLLSGVLASNVITLSTQTAMPPLLGSHGVQVKVDGVAVAATGTGSGSDFVLTLASAPTGVVTVSYPVNDPKGTTAEPIIGTDRPHGMFIENGTNGSFKIGVDADSFATRGYGLISGAMNATASSATVIVTGQTGMAATGVVGIAAGTEGFWETTNVITVVASGSNAATLTLSRPSPCAHNSGRVIRRSDIQSVTQTVLCNGTAAGATTATTVAVNDQVPEGRTGTSFAPWGREPAFVFSLDQTAYPAGSTLTLQYVANSSIGGSSTITQTAYIPMASPPTVTLGGTNAYSTLATVLSNDTVSGAGAIIECAGAGTLTAGFTRLVGYGPTGLPRTIQNATIILPPSGSQDPRIGNVVWKNCRWLLKEQCSYINAADSNVFLNNTYEGMASILYGSLTLSGSLGLTGTTLGITPANGSLFVASQVLIINSEKMLVETASASALTVTRPYAGTTAATHSAGTQISIVTTGATIFSENNAGNIGVSGGTVTNTLCTVFSSVHHVRGVWIDHTCGHGQNDGYSVGSNLWTNVGEASQGGHEDAFFYEGGTNQVNVGNMVVGLLDGLDFFAQPSSSAPYTQNRLFARNFTSVNGSGSSLNGTSQIGKSGTGPYVTSNVLLLGMKLANQSLLWISDPQTASGSTAFQNITNSAAWGCSAQNVSVSGTNLGIDLIGNVQTNNSAIIDVVITTLTADITDSAAALNALQTFTDFLVVNAADIISFTVTNGRRLSSSTTSRNRQGAYRGST